MNRALIFTLAALITAMVLLVVTALWPSKVYAHMTATGWAYDPVCCSGEDCAPVRVEIVDITPEGYVVNVGPGDHPLAKEQRTHLVPFDSTKIRFSEDADYHLCIAYFTNNLYCLYVPVMGA